MPRNSNQALPESGVFNRSKRRTTVQARPMGVSVNEMFLLVRLLILMIFSFYTRKSNKFSAKSKFYIKTDAYLRVFRRIFCGIFLVIFRGGREESRPYNTLVISMLHKGHITAIFIESAAVPSIVGAGSVRTGAERRCVV